MTDQMLGYELAQKDMDYRYFLMVVMIVVEGEFVNDKNTNFQFSPFFPIELIVFKVDF